MCSTYALVPIFIKPLLFYNKQVGPGKPRQQNPDRLGATVAKLSRRKGAQDPLPSGSEEGQHQEAGDQSLEFVNHTWILNFELKDQIKSSHIE